jgi:Flp pilus assembly protein TadD
MKRLTVSLLLMVSFPVLGRTDDEPAVDPALAGTWRAALALGQASWKVTFRVMPSGSYRSTIEGPGDSPDETGMFRARGGRWSVQADSGRTDQGTYQYDGKDTLVLTGQAGPVTWKRVASAAPAVANSPAGPTGGAAPAAAQAAPVQSARPEQPSGKAPQPDTLDQPPPAAEAVTAYGDGLDAIEAARFADAIAPLSRAIELDEDNASYYAARGTALVLAERISDGMKDLARARRLNPDDADARRMLSFAYRMLGDERGAAQVGPWPPNDAFDRYLLETGNNYGRLSTVLRMNMNNPQYRAETEQLRVQARAQLPQIGQRFAMQQKVASAAGDSLYPRAITRIAKRNWAGAQADLQATLAKAPDNWSARYYYGLCLLELGNLEGARTELTRALCWKPALVEGYAGRARAAAGLGEFNRAQADLDLAAQLDPSDARQLRAGLAEKIAALQAQAPSGELGPRLDALLQAARERGDWDRLVGLARDLLVTNNARRARGDERYQERRRQLSWAIAAEPQNPNRLADLGHFLLGEVDVRGEQVEPNGDSISYRPWTPAQKQAELALASRLFDSALQLDPRHVQAMVGQAALKIRDFQWADAENILNQALQIKSDVPELLQLMSQVMQEAADQRNANAANLRATKSWTEYGYNVTFYYTRYPSLDELDRADQYERQANQFLAFSRRYIETAIKARAGTSEGFYQQGLLAWNDKDYERAKTAMEQAVKLDPNNRKARYSLSNIYANLGQTEAAIDQQTRAKNLEETTTAPWLQRAWAKIVNTAFKASREALAQAQSWNPADPRIPAYLGVMAEANDKTDEAIACYTAAMAIEEARVRFSGTTLQPATKTPWLARDFGLTIAMLLKRARFFDSANPAEAAKLYLNITGFDPRVSDWEWGRRISSAMLPDTNADPKITPSPPMFITLMMQTRVSAGRALLAINQPNQAIAQYNTALTYPQRLRQGAMIDLDDWLDRAKLGMSESSFRLGDRNRANYWQMQVRGRDFNDPIEIERMRVKGLLGQTSRLRSGN